MQLICIKHHVQEVSCPVSVCFSYVLFCPRVPLLRFDSSTDVSGFNQAKSSVVRGIRTKLLDCYPGIQDFIRDILPKKEAVQILKWYFILCALTPLRTPSHSHEHVEILVIKNELLFFKQRDGPYVPTLRLLHKCTYAYTSTRAAFRGRAPWA